MERINKLFVESRKNIEQLHFDEVSVSTYEKDVPPEEFPSPRFHVEPGRRYRKDVIRYHIPFVGNEELLHCVPNPYSHWTTEVSIEDGSLCFDIINFYNDPERIKHEANQTIDFIKHQATYIANQVAAYNTSLASRAQGLFRERKQHLLKKNDLLASLGTPIKKRKLTLNFRDPHTTNQ